LIHVLKKLKEDGKTLFIVTNNHYPYSDVLLKATLGVLYRNYIDFTFLNAQKPEFFTEKNTQYLMHPFTYQMKYSTTKVTQEVPIYL